MKGLLNPQNNWESNLALSYNGKDVGYIKIAPTGNTVAYDVVLGFDVPQAGNFKIDLKGKGTYEYGLFPVVAPASFIEKKF